MIPGAALVVGLVFERRSGGSALSGASDIFADEDARDWVTVPHGRSETSGSV